MSKYLLGYDVGSSSVKAALIDAETGHGVASAFSPEKEMSIQSPHPGWAEQDPELWWKELVNATHRLHSQYDFDPASVISIGVSYQMHGLVCVDKNGKILRPAIIWCDSRAVKIGEEAFKSLGEDFCLTHYLNSPGNFTASKLKWVMENEPHVYEKMYKAMLPGDYIAYKLTDRMATTRSGLSEWICWDFLSQDKALGLIEHYGFSTDIFPTIVPTFGEQGFLSDYAANELNLRKGTSVCYRAGDQPNNAYSLSVTDPGEVVTTAGTSGVIYGVTEDARHDDLSRVNTFLHVNNTKESPRNGVLLCINGTGSANNWIKRNMAFSDYEEMNDLASQALPGSAGLLFFPFGNGAERVLTNHNIGARFSNLDFNVHGRGEVARSVQEGIVFAMRYGLEIMENMGLTAGVFKAGNANMFLSPVFREIFSNVTGGMLEIFDTDGAQGAARAAGVGCGYYKSIKESFTGLKKILQVEPDKALREGYQIQYLNWKDHLLHFLRNMGGGE